MFSLYSIYDFGLSDCVTQHRCRGYSIVTYRGRRSKDVFRDTMSYSLVDTVGTRHSVTFEKTVIYVVTATRTPNLTNLWWGTLVKEGYH